MLEETKIAILPAIALYNDKKLGSRKVRLAFCKKDDTLQEVERRLSKFKFLS
jgi:aspartate/methionine/tyrosine aminotransferase